MRRIYLLLLAVLCLLAFNASAARADTFQVTGDTYVDESAPTTNFVSNATVDVDGSPFRQGLLEYEPDAGTVDSAQLRIYSNSAVSENVNLRSISCSYDVSTVTWNTRPGTGTVIDSNSTISAGWNTFDVPDTAVNAGSTTCFMLSKSGSTRNQFQSLNQPNPSELVVTYDVTPPPPTADRYAAVDGLSTGTCSTVGTACTISRANSQALAGETVSVASGTYTGTQTFSTSGVTWVSEVKHGAILQGAPTSGDHVQMTATNVTLDGFQVTGGRIAVSMRASGTRFVNGYVHDVWQSSSAPPSGGAAIDVYNSGNTSMTGIEILGNRVDRAGQTVGSNQTMQGIYISVPCSGCLIQNNVVTRVTDYGIHGYHNACSWTVTNNTVTGNGRGILSGPGFLTRNNISWNNGNTFALSSTQTSCSGGYTLSNSLTSNPNFVNGTPGVSEDFRVQAGSGAIDTGTSTNAPAVDYAGTARPQGSGYDIGAYDQ